MNKLFSYENKIMSLLNKFADIIIISIFWILLSLTIIGFGPACTAAYYATTKSIRHNHGGIVREFWRCMKDNFWNASILGILLALFSAVNLLIDAIEIADYFLNGTHLDTWTVLLFMLKAFFTLGLAVYMFPVLSRFKMNIAQVFTWSVLFIFRHIGYTVIMLAMFLLAVGVIAVFPFSIVVIPGLFFYSVSYPMERILKYHTPEEGNNQDSTERPWYLEE